MQPAETFALVVALAGALHLAAGAAFDLVRVVTRLRLGRLPSLRRTLAANGLVLFVARAAPAGASLPPPAMRLEAPVPDGAASDIAPSPVQLASSTGDTYRVRPGDSLWAIAARTLGDAPNAAIDGYWRAIYEANRELVGDDPDLIFPGQLLTLPAR